MNSLDDYQVIKKLGEGAYGNVYKARQRSNSQLVALKVMMRSKFDLEGNVSTFSKAIERESEVSELISDY